MTPLIEKSTKVVIFKCSKNYQAKHHMHNEVQKILNATLVWEITIHMPDFIIAPQL